MTFHYYHLLCLKRAFLYLLGACLLISFLLSVHLFSSPRAFNHFVFHIKQPARYIEYLRSGYHVQTIDCLVSGSNKSFAYEDITRSAVPPQSIFFIETSCKHEHGVELSLRQACSIESAAKMNPSRQVFVLIISSVRNGTRSAVLETLHRYSNVKVVQVDLDRYFENTPLHSFYTEDTVLTSLWPLSHMSDVLRYVTLYKYGGTYLDLDFVVIRSLESLHNYAGAESSVVVAAGVIHLDQGHWLSEAALEELKAHFDTGEWGANGPGVITRLLRRECSGESFSATVLTCSNFTVYPPSYFYPVRYPQWRDYFNTSEAAAVMSSLHNSYAAHVWNSFSKQEPVRLNSNQPYAQLATRFCPRISALANDSF